MEREELELMMDRLDETNEEVMRCREATEWLEDHCKDQNLSSNLGLIRKNLSRVEYQLSEMLGRLPQAELAENVGSE